MDIQLSEFFFRLILVFIPGVIAFIIVKQLTVHKKYEFYEEAVYSFVLGWASYLAYFLILQIMGHVEGFWGKPTTVTFYFLNVLRDGKQPLNFHEIFNVSFLSIIIGFIFSLAINQSWLHWVANKMKISKKFGDLSVFDFVMNSPMPPWVVVRDLKNDHMYQGFISVFPDSTEENGIFLEEVTVYVNSTGVKLYESPGLFIERDRRDLIYDFPLLGLKGKGKSGKEKGNVKRQ